MNFDNLISTVRMLGQEKKIWLTNETFNELGKQKFRVNRKDNLIIYSDDIEIEISVKEELKSNCLTSFAKVERVSEVFQSTQLIKENIYISTKTSQKLSVIL